MPTFHGQNLFDSGPSCITPGPLALRAGEQDAPLGDGAALLAQGTHTRPITLRGRLFADDPAALYERMDAIEDLIDGQPHRLVDDDGKTYPACVATRFEPGPVTRHGTRVAVDYTLRFTQVRP